MRIQHKTRIILLKWIAIPLAFSAFGYYVIGPRMSKDPLLPGQISPDAPSAQFRNEQNQSELYKNLSPRALQESSKDPSKPKLKVQVEVSVDEDNKRTRSTNNPSENASTDLGMPQEEQETRPVKRGKRLQERPRTEQPTPQETQTKEDSEASIESSPENSHETENHEL
jgi:hypothetical protein